MISSAVMRQPWRTTALILFVTATVGGGLLGDRLLAVPEEQSDDLRLFTELLQTAHAESGDELTYRDLVYASIQGMLRSLDPHTSFLSPEAYDRMRERQAASFYGLGILVSMRNGQLTVISPLEGTPAWRLGIRAGDIISAIEGEPTDSMSLDEAIDQLKGPKGTVVNIEIVRRGLEDPLPLAVTRDEIPQNTVRYAYMMEPGTGYIRLTDFSRSTAQEMADALESLSEQGMERLVLDLRSNGGGLLDQVVEVANRFVPDESRIVETRGRTRDSHQAFFARQASAPIGVPVVVLVNNGTASAAEILAGAIQDHDMGLVVGTPTWGKGLVQTVYNLSYGAGIALTTAKYYTPAGRLIQRDYSSFFDYYTHFDNASADSETPSIDLGDQPTFTTDLGREVYGGGGITPDVLTDLPDLPKLIQFLYARNAFFDFAVEWRNTHEDAIQDPSWRPPTDFLAKFEAWLVREEIVAADDLAERFAEEDARIIAERQIVSDIMNSAFGPEAAHRIQAEGDTQIQKALSLFPRAVELLASRTALGDETPRMQGTERPAGGVDGRP